MELSVKILDIFFRRISAERYIEELCNPVSSQNNNDFFEQAFLSMAESTLSGYSRNEQRNIYHYACEVGKQYNSVKGLPPFYLLADYGNAVLCIAPTGPVCQFKKLLDWREGYLCLGQDTIITAWLANRSKLQRNVSEFAWPAIVRTDNPHIEQILVGLTENHMHLYAGASTFSLTWCCVMNDPQNAVNTSGWIGDGLLQMRGSRTTSENIWPINRCIIYAAKIRKILFAYMKVQQSETPYQQFKKFHSTYANETYSVAKLQREIDQLRFLYGLKFDQPDGSSICLDYAFCSELSESIEKDSRLMAAERLFLYRCFRKCFSGEFDAQTQKLFYCYLLLKAQFRSEFIQLNRQTGFENFHDYDSRKYKLWINKSEFWHEDYRQALNAAFNEQKLFSLEGRLSPKETVMKNIRTIYAVDRAKLYFDENVACRRRRIIDWSCSYDMENKAEEERFHYLMHFPKRKDQSEHYPAAKCRNFNLRQTTRNQSIALAKAFSNSSYFCDRVRGIDACSNEIGCRPEVFANAFRFLRNFRADYYKWIAFSGKTPFLRATYHAGEDFLDISDGLRAIDEAIRFLELKRGDRLGHVLALGVDPGTHYQLKYNEIILPKQELLDNLVWCLYRSIELGVEIDSLRRPLTDNAQKLFDAIYKPVCTEYATLEDYYHSMLLRGDMPECYKHGEFVEFPQVTDPYDFYALCQYESVDNQLNSYRLQPQIVQLYQMYHYSAKVRTEGNEITTFRITKQYIQLMVEMQKAMQRYVNNCGVSIECCPTSNVLIGTFKQYSNHPILRLNQFGLDNGIEQDPQMHVSINSDDPGVFDTSLTFEYELLAAALVDITDDTGNQKYTDQKIKTYMKNIIEMGREQCFADYHL